MPLNCPDLWSQLLTHEVERTSTAQTSVAIQKLNEVIHHVNAVQACLFLGKDLEVMQQEGELILSGDEQSKLKPDLFMPVLVASLPQNVSVLKKLSKQMDRWSRIIPSVGQTSTSEFNAENEMVALNVSIKRSAESSGKISNTIFQLAHAISIKLELSSQHFFEKKPVMFAVALEENIFLVEHLFRLEQFCLLFEKHLDQVSVNEPARLAVIKTQRDLLVALKKTLYEPSSTLIEKFQKFHVLQAQNKKILSASIDSTAMILLKSMVVVLATVLGCLVGGIYAYHQLLKTRGAIFNHDVMTLNKKMKIATSNTKQYVTDLEMNLKTPSRI